MKLNELENLYDNRLNNLDEYVDQFARIDLNNLSEHGQQFVELTHAGPPRRSRRGIQHPECHRQAHHRCR